jgi:DNA-directed RNA polymerase specialized sigma24 family protein
MINRLRDELESCVQDAAAQAARQIAACEAERTRRWFETKALPKAVRVAQRETYDLLRKYGGIGGRSRARADLSLGCAPSVDTPPAARVLTAEEIQETAEACIALLEVQGKAVEATLAELSAAEGGWLLPQDVARVREVVLALALARHESGNGW